MKNKYIFVGLFVILVILVASVLFVLANQPQSGDAETVEEIIPLTFEYEIPEDGYSTSLGKYVLSAVSNKKDIQVENSKRVNLYLTEEYMEGKY